LTDDLLLKASGGNHRKKRLVDVATMRVDFISMGALTHSVKVMDISLKGILEPLFPSGRKTAFRLWPVAHTCQNIEV